jgi:quinol monooxygenase YgiN
MGYYGYHGRITAQDGKLDELLDILIKASELLKENADCFHYVVGVGEENDIWVSELWKNKKAHDISLTPENISSLIMTARPFIKDMGDTVETTVYGGKGVPS